MTTWNIRRLDYAQPGTFHVYHDGPKDEARQRARCMAERAYPPADGYRHRWDNDCVLVFRENRHIADFAVDPVGDVAERAA